MAKNKTDEGVKKIEQSYSFKGKVYTLQLITPAATFFVAADLESVMVTTPEGVIIAEVVAGCGQNMPYVDIIPAAQV